MNISTLMRLAIIFTPIALAFDECVQVKRSQRMWYPRWFLVATRLDIKKKKHYFKLWQKIPNKSYYLKILKFLRANTYEDIKMSHNN